MWLKQRGPIKRLFSVSLSIQINQEEKLWDHGSPSTIRGEWEPGYGQVAWNAHQKNPIEEESLGWKIIFI